MYGHRLSQPIFHSLTPRSDITLIGESSAAVGVQCNCYWVIGSVSLGAKTTRRGIPPKKAIAADKDRARPAAAAARAGSQPGPAADEAASVASACCDAAIPKLQKSAHEISRCEPYG